MEFFGVILIRLRNVGLVINFYWQLINHLDFLSIIRSIFDYILFSVSKSMTFNIP
jgi:hypothetical protein